MAEGEVEPEPGQLAWAHLNIPHSQPMIICGEAEKKTILRVHSRMGPQTIIPHDAVAYESGMRRSRVTQKECLRLFPECQWHDWRDPFSSKPMVIQSWKKLTSPRFSLLTASRHTKDIFLFPSKFYVFLEADNWRTLKSGPPWMVQDRALLMRSDMCWETLVRGSTCTQ